ncbi:MAG: polyketide synthase dehydratase domain-containing protein, partial [Pseudomonadota bacterium]
GDFVTAASGAAWSFDPGLLDGVLQMTWIWTTAYQGGVMLPAGIGAVHRHGGDVSDGPLYAELRVLTGRDDMSPVTTTCVYDRGGRPCFTVERMQAQTSQQLNRLRGGWQGGRRAQDTSFDTVRR